MKKLALLLLLSLCLGALVACTVSEIEPETTATTVTGEAVTTATPETEAATEAATSATTEAPTAASTEGSTEGTTEAATEAPTEAATEAATEAVTLAPRYDYFEAEVLPGVSLEASHYTDLTLTLPASLRVTEEDVMDYIEYLRFQYREAVNGDVHVTDKPLALGDDAFIYYKGVMNGEEFEGGSNWEAATPHQLGLGSGAFIPGFEEGLVGVIPANATRENPAEVHVTFPENYDPALAGKDAVFYVAVVYSVQYTLPEYNRDFVENTLYYEPEKDFYAGDKALLLEFEEFVKEYLEGQIGEDVEYAKMDALWTHLTEAVVCAELPQPEMDYYYNAYLGEIEYYYEYYSGYGGEEFLKEYPTLGAFACSYLGLAADGDWEAELTALATAMVKKDVIGHAIAEREGFETVTEEEFKAELKYWVDYYNGYMTEEEILANMGEAAIRETAFAEKVQTWLLERVTFVFEE